MNKPILPFVETMITQACNLSCYGCTNYSDLVHSGYIRWAEGKQQIIDWLNRVNILDFGIIGGEPLINPECDKWITGVREVLPDAQIRFTTNGINLNKKIRMVGILKEVGNSVLKITIHEDNDQIESTVNNIFKMYDWQPVTEYGIQRYKTNNNFRLQINRPNIFYKTYKNTYENMMPHDNNPADAFDLCVQKTCPLLYNGRLYKCSTAGLLENTLAKFNNPNFEKWKPVIDYGLPTDCSDEALSMFLNNFGKPNSICSQCPSQSDIGSKIMHLQNVDRKKSIV
jgi:organic radical activating enzyme